VDRRKIIPQHMPQTVTVCNIMYALGSMQWPQEMPQTVTVCNIMYALGSMNGRANGAFAMPSQCQANQPPQPLFARTINQAPEGKLH